MAFQARPPVDRVIERRRAEQKAAQRRIQRGRNDRRIVLPPELDSIVRERARKSKRSANLETAALVRAGLEAEAQGVRTDTPLERRVRELLMDDPNLTREAAIRVARAGNHHR